MKIALVVPGGVDRSGVDRVIPAFLWLIERLARRHELHVFAMRQEAEPADWELLGAHVHNIGTARGSTARLLSRFSAEHDVQPFDVMHAFFGWCGAAAAIVGWRRRVPLLFSEGGGEFICLREIDYGMQCRPRDRMGAVLAVKRARRITVATPYMQRLASARGATADVVPLGVALDQWSVSPPRRRDLSQPLRLLHVGDARPVKDQRILMAACDELAAAGLAFDLQLVGLDTEHIPVNEGISSQVHRHGVLRRDALRALMDRADLLVVTSRHEAGPLAFLEAAIAGVPTVGTAVGHVAEFAPRGAVAVPIGDSSALAREILALATDEDRRLSIADRAQRRAIVIDADFTAAAFERIYADMLGALQS